ncbi:hypothetical protein GCM10010505_54430 [Kitasatospora aburaviensis]
MTRAWKCCSAIVAPLAGPASESYAAHHRSRVPTADEVDVARRARAAGRDGGGRSRRAAPEPLPLPRPAGHDPQVEYYEVKPTPRSANILIASPRNSTILGW